MRRLSPERIEKKLRIELMSRVLSPLADDHHHRIYNAARKINGDGRVYFLLTAFPEQFEDVFGVLVDDREVVFFELLRDDVLGEPQNVEKFRYETYRRKIRGARNVEEFRIATEIVRAMICARASKI